MRALAADFSKGDASRRELRWRLVSLLIVAALLLTVHTSRGLRFEHWLLAALFALLALFGPRGRRLSALLLPLVVTGLAYEYFALLLPWRGPVRVATLHAVDWRWFGVETAAGRLTWPEYFAIHHHPILDLLCGFAYLVYMFETFLLAVYFTFVDATMTQRIAWSFLAVNVLGMAIWLAYPAAPPWYVIAHGTGAAQLDVLPSAAGAARFDALLGIHYFQAFYSRSTNVFGAMPSLHVAYPTMIACLVWHRGWRWRLPTLLFAAWVAFSAVYLVHHYVVDLLAGVACAMLAAACVVSLQRRARRPFSSTANS